MQESQQPDKLKVGEALYLYASFYPRAADPEGLLVALGLADKRSTPFAKLSGGQAVLAVQVLPVIVAGYREKGILRRMSTTPVRPLALLSADVAVNVSVVVCAIAVVATVGKLAFGVSLPTQGFGFVLVLVLTAATVLALGALVASCRALCGT